MENKFLFVCLNVQNLQSESTIQNTTNDKNLPKNFNFFVLMIKELQEKVI